MGIHKKQEQLLGKPVTSRELSGHRLGWEEHRARPAAAAVQSRNRLEPGWSMMERPQVPLSLGAVPGQEG